ncbi:MAG: RNA polymerase sigma factor [Halanaerobiales bacterium]
MIKPNNESVFEEFYSEYWPKIYNFIYYRVQNEEEAEELSQEVFHRVYKQLKKKKSIDQLIAYTYMIARNIVYDLWRKRGRTPEMSYIEDLSMKGFELEAKEEFLEESVVVSQMLESLSDTAREVVILRIIKGYSITDVAKHLNKPEGTIKSIQYRALEKLRKGLKEGGVL